VNSANVSIFLDARLYFGRAGESRAIYERRHRSTTAKRCRGSFDGGRIVDDEGKSEDEPSTERALMTPDDAAQP